MVIVKYALVALLVAAALIQLRTGWMAASLNLHRLRHWKRFTAKVYGGAGPVALEVQTSSEWNAPKLKVQRTYDAGYPTSEVTVLENPENPEDRRLTSFFDLWNPVLVAAVFALALAAGALLVWNQTWGADAVWSGGGWKTAPVPLSSYPADFEVREPRESWIANVVFGCMLGLPFALPPLFMRGDWRPWTALATAAGAIVFLYLMQSAVLNYTRTVRFSAAGIEERSLFSRKLVPLEELGGLEFRDAGQDLQKLRPLKDRNTLTHIRVWAVKDKDGREPFSLPEGMRPESVFVAMRERIGRAPAR